jgi:hypothetical protein
MKKNKIIGTVAVVAIATMFALNINYAIEGYGIKNVSLHPEVIAQTNGTGGSTTGGSTTGGGTTGGGTTGGGTTGGGTTGGGTTGGYTPLTYMGWGMACYAHPNIQIWYCTPLNSTTGGDPNCTAKPCPKRH